MADIFDFAEKADAKRDTDNYEGPNKDICTHCGEHAGKGEKFCSYCGCRIAVLRNTKNPFNCVFCHEEEGTCFFNCNWTCNINCNRQIKFNPRTEFESKQSFDKLIYYILELANAGTTKK